MTLSDLCIVLDQVALYCIALNGLELASVRLRVILGSLQTLLIDSIVVCRVTLSTVASIQEEV